MSQVPSGWKAELIAFSKGPDGQELKTFAITYPRFIHAEFMTHREFSRNASSSRAIPAQKLIDMVRENPAMPVHWGVNQAGMQAEFEMAPEMREEAIRFWREAANSAANHAERMMALGAHKQVVNRILEPYVWMTTIFTTASLANFYALRDHDDADPTIRRLAQEIRGADIAGVPTHLMHGEWHLPYIRPKDWVDFENYIRFSGKFPEAVGCSEGEHRVMRDLARHCSAARCARVSYLTHDGKQPSIENDLALYNRLAGSHPIHASPLEHQASPDNLLKEDGVTEWQMPWAHGNLPGWIQFRKLVPGEYVKALNV